MEEGKNSGEPASYRESQSFKQNYAGTSVAKRIHEQANSIDANEKSTDTEREILPVEMKVSIDRCLAWLSKNHNAVTAVSTCLIFVVTALYALFAILQWRAMKESNQINRASLYAVQRAFITFDRIAQDVVRVTDPPGTNKVVGYAFQINAKWQNVGNTPATDVVTVFGIRDHQMMDEPNEEMFSGIGQLKDQPILWTAAVGPSTPLESRNFYVPVQALTDITGGNERFMWGWVFYRDTFPNTKPHVTEFCNHIDLMAKSTTEEHAYRISGSYCRHHNCVDDSCPDYDSLVKMVEAQAQR